MSAELAQAIQLAQGGDRQAFYLLYREHIGRVYAICWRMLGDRHKAEDGCQEIFIKVWQKLPGFQGDSSFSTWLHSIATRTAVDVWRLDRRLKFVDENEVISALDEKLQDATPEPTRADAPELEQAIQRLPPQAKSVFILFALEGYQHSEIAAMLVGRGHRSGARGAALLPGRARATVADAKSLSTTTGMPAAYQCCRYQRIFLDGE